MFFCRIGVWREFFWSVVEVLFLTKSRRRKDKNMGRPEWVATDERCEECGGEMVKTSRYTYTCTVCGLMQVRHPMKKGAMSNENKNIE